MIDREQKKLLKDIYEAAISVDFHLERKRDFAEYAANKTKRRAIEREFEIIGEAMARLLKINPEVPLSHSRIIVDLRNRVIHAYDNIDDVLIWKIIMKDLPQLIIEVEKLLG